MRNYTVIAACLWLLIALWAMFAFTPASPSDMVCIASQALENGVQSTTPVECFAIPE